MHGSRTAFVELFCKIEELTLSLSYNMFGPHSQTIFLSFLPSLFFNSPLLPYLHSRVNQHSKSYFNSQPLTYNTPIQHSRS